MGDHPMGEGRVGIAADSPIPLPHPPLARPRALHTVSQPRTDVRLRAVRGHLLDMVNYMISLFIFPMSTMSTDGSLGLRVARSSSLRSSREEVFVRARFAMV